MTGREPCLEVMALDLNDAFEFHVSKLSTVAGCVHDGLRRLEQRCDFSHREEAIVQDGGDKCFWDESLRQFCVSSGRAFRCIC